MNLITPANYSDMCATWAKQSCNTLPEKSEEVMTVKSSVGFVSGCKLLAKPIAYIVIECLKHRGITVVGNGGVTIGHSCLCSLPICCGSTRLFACLDRWLDVFAKIEPISMSGLVCIGPNAVLDIVRSAAKVYQRTQIIFNAANSEAARL